MNLSAAYNEIAARLRDATGLEWCHIERRIYAGEEPLDLLAVTFPDNQTAPIVEEHLNRALAGNGFQWRGAGAFSKEPLRNGQAFIMGGDYMQGQILMIPAPAVEAYAVQSEHFFDVLPVFDREPA